MSAEVKSHLTELLTRALAKVAPQQPGSLISLERPKQSQHGDFSCPAAMQLARALKRNPRELALELVAALPPSEWLERAPTSSRDRKSTRLNSSHGYNSYAVFCLKKKNMMFPAGGGSASVVAPALAACTELL